MSERVWNLIGKATMPRWWGLYRGPYWWRSLNAWWLAHWGSVFFHQEPWHVFRRRAD